MSVKHWISALLSVVVVFVMSASHAADDEKPTPGYQPVVVVQLAVKDLNRSVKFYQDVIGLELEYRVEQLQWAKFKTALPGLTIGLGEGGKTHGSGVASVNLAVGDTDAARALLEKRGAKFLGETQDIPGVVRLATFQDPDGNRFKLAGPSKGAGR